MSTKKIASIGVLSAMAMVVALFIRFPIVPAVAWLQYEPKDVIIVIGGFLYGPMSSFIMSAICSILEIMLKGGTYIDVIMNMISTCAFACPAAYLYKKYHTKNGAIIGLIIGTILSVVCMLIWNYIMTPIYYQMPREAVVALLLPGILPFNLIKCGVNAIITFLLYKPLVTILRRTHLADKEGATNKYTGIILVVLFIIVTVLALYIVH